MGVLVSDRFTTDYEINADLQKWLNNGLNVYALGADDRLAHIAVDDATAKTIPLGYAATSASDYIFALDARYDMSDWAEVWLYDAQTGQHVNLLTGNYTFRASVGTHDDRFTLSLVRADKQSLPTDVPAVNILSDGQVRVYDMLGRYISDTTLGLTAGVYLVWQGGQCRKMYID